MDTKEFLDKILPSSGLYVLAEFWWGLKENPGQTVHKTIPSLIKRMRYVDRKKKINTFHACASYKEHRLSKAKGGPGGMRKADNAAYVKSQWVDIDVGPGKPYADRNEAIKALAKACKTIGIPAPMIVKSGVGLHCYWPFDRDVEASVAQPYMQAFANALTASGLKQDASRTADLASVLRTVGSHHRKAEPIEVTLIRDADPINPYKLYSVIEDHLPPVSNSSVLDEWGTGPVEYPPSYATKIVKQCGTLQLLSEVRGDVEEPLWRAMLGLLKHCEDGEHLAHEWSDGHPDYNYSETQEKMELWEAGPPTCQQFSNMCEECDTCPFREKIKSPIHLGYDELQTHPVIATDAEDEETAEDEEELDIAERKVISYLRKMPHELPFWPKNYRWDGYKLSKFVKSVEEDEPDRWVPFTDKLVYPFIRYPDDEGEMQLRVSVLISGKRKRWKEFDVPAKALADNKATNSALGAYEVYCMGTKGTVMAREFFQDVISGMQTLDIETSAYSNFGWHNGAFVIGTTALTPKGPEPVFLSEKVPEDANADFGMAGSTERWAELIDEIYNRPGAEPYQFMICAGFGAPLVSLANSDLWHGIPIALTGEGGLGKTTTCHVACSMYGAPGRFSISTNELGATMNALISRVGLMRHLPLVMDEMTGRKTEEMQAMLYALSNGKPKERNRPDGSLISVTNRWDTLTFITGNMNITAMLGQLDKHRAEATQLRCFEIPLDDGFNDRVFAGMNAKDMIEKQLLGENYGHAGREYLAYVLKNKDTIAKQLHKLRSKFAPTSRDETRERFYLDCIATALLGGMIAKKLGLISFDLAKIQKWAVEHTKSLRVNRSSNLSTVEDYLGEFLTALHGRTVVTETMGDARSKQRIEIDTKEVREPVARLAHQDRKFFVMNKYFNDWCSKHNIHAKWLKDELDKRGLLLRTQGDVETKISLFKGTTLPSTQQRCLQLDYDMLMSAATGPTLRVVGS